MGTLYSKLSNYYGIVGVSDVDGKYTMILEDHSSMQSIEISKDFWEAFIKEFKGRQSDEHISLL